MVDVLILGADGYTGWCLAAHLTRRGDRVHGVDNLGARDYRGKSVTPIAGWLERARVLNERASGSYSIEPHLDVTDYRRLRATLEQHEPETVVNLAQIPSAPYSMRDVGHAWDTQANNVRGALNLHWAIEELGLDTHVVQLATMGEYGVYPDGIPIPEGFLADGRPAPKLPGSFYHASKAMMTTNAQFVARTWGHDITEIYQGIVYGLHTDATAGDDRLLTRFDADATFGTVLNRFTAQAAVGHPLTVYGDGGQKRAMLSLADCIQCLTLAIDEPASGYRAINQFDGAYRVRELADMVAERTGAAIEHLPNPRVEDDSAHAYDPEREVLDTLGYEPTRSIEAEFELTYETVQRYADRIDERELRPRTRWREPAVPDGGGCIETAEAFEDWRR